ncbi:metal cation symporter ZIP14-like [Macrosteles quadrilineatus]|uniref:metal cation symporter ZIP14-like n=1 Tax=Macrosteles quadrilineatus TaxID=74068 RepID=UPI0023E2E43D|nr:metal cation symporter ZIP14-like [Macrosteles quadrilineatus]XP_054290547.1 metal cation symporter ZIP14-like [Macrosteles quadrilineatus]
MNSKFLLGYILFFSCMFVTDVYTDCVSSEAYNFSSAQLQVIVDRFSKCSENKILKKQTYNCLLSEQEESLKSNLAQTRTKPTQSEVWGLGLMFVTAISLCSLLGVSVLPLMQKAFYKQMLTALIGLAVGSLTSSSLFHLIPQALNLMDGDVGHSYLRISLMMWSGIWVFFMIERIMKVINDERARRSKKEPGSTALRSPDLPSDNPIYECQEQAIKASFGHQQKPKHCHGTDHVLGFQKNSDNVIATVAWMVIFGDGIHNFIDGLSIGAAFNESILTGISISVAVMCEEFPHELGDFAVLLNAGMTMRQALLYNFLSACTCYLGLFVGILLGEVEASVYIFGFAAGMFLYIALVDMVPEMNEVAEEASKKSVGSALWTLLLQNLGMGTGVLVLYLLARYQDYIDFT